MRTSGVNPWKLGLFVVVGCAFGAGTLWWLGVRRFDRETFQAVTYFDESVSGLDLGAPVKMRGVRIGNVSDITFAPDKRNVEVRMQIFRAALEKLGLDFEETVDRTRDRLLPPELRVQLAVTGLTGIRFLLVDFLDPQRFPERKLDFVPPMNYVPAAPSTLKSLEDGLIDLLESIPPIAVELESLARGLNDKLSELDAQSLSRQAAQVLAHFDGLLAAFDPAPLLAEAREAVAEVHRAATDARELLARTGAVDGPLERSGRSFESLAARFERALDELAPADTGHALRDAADALRELARDAGGLTTRLPADLAALREALSALRALAEYLERDPGALLRGAKH